MPVALVTICYPQTTSVLKITDPSTLAATDSADWSLAGNNGTDLLSGFVVTSPGGITITTTFAEPFEEILIPWLFTGSFFWSGGPLNESGLGANRGGATTFSFSRPVSGAGLFVQVSHIDSPGPFTASLSAYNGITLLGTFIEDGNSFGQQIFLGVSSTSANITSVVINTATVSYGMGTLRLRNGPARCTTNVTGENQGDPRWATNLYDHSSTLTVRQEGCALTSLSMALNNAGINNDPGSLNEFMRATDTDYSGLGVNWGPATRDVSGNTLKFHAQRIDSTVDLQGAKQYLNTVVCQQHNPVIVGVDLNDQGDPGHFVLVTGKDNDDYTITDPGFAKTVLSEYDNEFVTRGFVADPPGDLSELDLATGDVAETLITDPLGRQTGFTPNLQKIVEQIPTSAYFRDSLQDDVSGAPATQTNHLTEIFQPIQGTYEIMVNGLKLGTYSLSVRTFSQDGSSQPDVLIPGIAGPGSSSTFSVQLASTPGSTSTVTVTATFSSTLTDINNSLQFGLIDNQGIANSLAEKIEAAQEATGNTRNNIVNAFINEVNAQAGKHITGLAVQVLLADANALSAH